MRLYLCGQRSFGAEALRALREDGHDILGVSSPAGPDRLTALAAAYGLRWFPSGALTAEALPATTQLIVAAHSHDFIGRRTRARAEYGAIGYHPSLLPRHRGRDAVRWTIHLGDPVAGGTVYWLSENVDAGPLAAQEWCWVRRGWTASDLWREALFPMGLRLLRQVVADVADGRCVAVPQDEELATWEPSWERPPLRRPELAALPPAGGAS